MSPKITDYDAWRWCDVCDKIILVENFDFATNSCFECLEEGDVEV